MHSTSQRMVERAFPFAIIGPCPVALWCQNLPYGVRVRGGMASMSRSSFISSKLSNGQDVAISYPVPSLPGFPKAERLSIDTLGATCVTVAMQTSAARAVVCPGLGFAQRGKQRAIAADQRGLPLSHIHDCFILDPQGLHCIGKQTYAKRGRDVTALFQED